MADHAVLLGNGFSRAYDDDLFSYRSLFKSAKFTGRLRRIFDMLETSDFEFTLRRLQESLEIVPHYNIPKNYRELISSGIDVVRNALIQAVKKHHPAGADELDEDESLTCASF